ncbi:MAG: FkbM family methyltransferase [Geminicoccaceae bacterium]
MRDIIDLIEEQTKLPDQIRITDVGAMNVGGEEPWQGLIDRGLATLLGFEPQADECERCNAESRPGRHFLPEALGDGEIWPFYQCKFGATSSIYEPNLELICQFNGLTDLMEVIETSKIPPPRLDDIEEARQTDFLKLDIQGAELILLQNATETLKNVSIIQTEVNFVPLYKDQPLFAEVDQCLRAQGFMLHTLLGCFGKRMLQPLVAANSPYIGFNQALWSDAVYVKPLWSLNKIPSPSFILKYAILSHVLFNSYDFTARALHEYDRFAGTNLTNAYVASFGEQLAA